MDYVIPEKLLQAIVGVMNELPARVSRGILNDLEHIARTAEAAKEAANDSASAKQA